MTWLPWLLLLALGAATLWGYSTVATHVRWARRALLTKGHTPRPQGWLVHKLQLEELFDAIERRADGEGELRAKSARRIEALLAPLTVAAGGAYEGWIAESSFNQWQHFIAFVILTLGLGLYGLFYWHMVNGGVH